MTGGQPTYRYLLCDLRTDQPLTWLPLKNVSFEDRLGFAGAFAGTLDMPNAQQVRLGKLVQQYAGRGALWVYRDHPDTGAQVWWGGIVWGATPGRGDRGSLQLSVSAATFWSYAHHRKLRVDKTYTGTSQNSLVNDLWLTMQGQPGTPGNIGVWYSTSADTDAPRRDRLYLASDNATFGDRLEELGAVIDGPEAWVQTRQLTDGTRRKLLKVHRRIGEVDPVATFTTSERGGSIVAWDEPTTATESGTHYQARGAAPEVNAAQEQQPLLSDVMVASELIGRGWPQLDVTTDHSEVTQMGTLNSYALQNMAATAGQVTTSSCTVRVLGTGWTPQTLGSTVRLRMDDLWHTPAVDRLVRPVAFKVTPSDRNGQESVDLIYDERGA